MFDQLIAEFERNPAALSIIGVLVVVSLIIIAWALRRQSKSASRAEPAKPSASMRPDSSEAKPAPAPPSRSEEMVTFDIGEEPQIARSRKMSDTSDNLGEDKEDHYVVTVHFGTDRDDKGATSKPTERFTCDRARPAAGKTHITYGTCEVSIPKIHKIGELEQASWYQSSKPGKHVLLLGVDTKDAEAFFKNLNTAMADRKQAFIFVHGFSVSFADAARRTAQLAFDMKFPGAPIFFSWPTEVLGLTNPDPTAYSEAENNSRWATQHFRAFLQDVIQKTGAETVHLIAHSMGNRVVTDALMELFWILRESEKDVIGEVILTAPDIDADVFVQQIAPRITQMKSRVTLYASTKDTALSSSSRVHGYPRVGDFAALHALPALPDKVEIVDASEVDTDSFGHSYYGNTESVISDICHLITARTPALSRAVTLAAQTSPSGAAFWRVKRETQLAQVWASIKSNSGVG